MLRFASRQLLLHTAKMPAFVLHGSRTSTNTARVRLTLAEGNFIDYELVVLNLLEGEQKASRRSFVETSHGVDEARL
jgi:glutathione S-transferase